MKKYDNNDNIFDGFMHRPFREESDGWMNEMPYIEEYPEVVAAKGIIAMFEEIRSLRKELWSVRQERDMYKEYFYNRYKKEA